MKLAHHAACLIMAVWLWPAQSLAQANDEASNQRYFEAAIAAERAGELGAAILMLSALAAETDAPRVRLELARVLFKAGELRQAREQFERVYRQDLPYPVRRSVNLFLEDIDQQVGYLRPSGGIVFDDNPQQAADSGVYDIFGAPLNYVRTSKAALGVSYRLEALRPLGGVGDGLLQAVASIEGRAFDQPHVGFRAAEAGLRYADPAKRQDVTLGWRGYETGGQRSSTPFVSYQRRVVGRRGSRIDLFAAAEINRFPGASYRRGETVRVASPISANSAPTPAAARAGVCRGRRSATRSGRRPWSSPTPQSATACRAPS